MGDASASAVQTASSVDEDRLDTIGPAFGGKSILLLSENRKNDACPRKSTTAENVAGRPTCQRRMHKKPPAVGRRGFVSGHLRRLLLDQLRPGLGAVTNSNLTGLQCFRHFALQRYVQQSMRKISALHHQMVS